MFKGWPHLQNMLTLTLNSVHPISQIATCHKLLVRTNTLTTPDPSEISVWVKLCLFMFNFTKMSGQACKEFAGIRFRLFLVKIRSIINHVTGFWLWSLFAFMVVGNLPCDRLFDLLSVCPVLPCDLCFLDGKGNSFVLWQEGPVGLSWSRVSQIRLLHGTTPCKHDKFGDTKLIEF